jgi:hypothetical protein
MQNDMLCRFLLGVLRIAGVQTDGGLVEDVTHTTQV